MKRSQRLQRHIDCRPIGDKHRIRDITACLLVMSGPGNKKDWFMHMFLREFSDVAITRDTSLA